MNSIGTVKKSRKAIGICATNEKPQRLRMFVLGEAGDFVCVKDTFGLTGCVKNSLSLRTMAVV
jgi:hypothetical protein